MWCGVTVVVVTVTPKVSPSAWPRGGFFESIGEFAHSLIDSQVKKFRLNYLLLRD